MTVEATFAEELPGRQNSDDRFLPLFGKDGEFDPAFLNVENRVGGFALRKNDLVFLEFRYCFPLPYFGEKYFGIERGLWLSSSWRHPFFLLARAALSPDEGRARRGDYSDSTAQRK